MKYSMFFAEWVNKCSLPSFDSIISVCMLWSMESSVQFAKFIFVIAIFIDEYSILMK